MRAQSRFFVGMSAAVLLAGAGVSLRTSTAAAAGESVQSLHFAVTLTDGEKCDVVADLHLPADASASHRVPAILMTNGWGGSKDDNAAAAKMFTGLDYAVLSYSGLGFGGSTCPISMDDPAKDGKAASHLVSYLGGASGIAYIDAAHTQPAPVLNVVQRDSHGREGTALPHDPRVGMLGGSYAGAVQLAAASVDPRIDALVPMITWNDLGYSLFPNNTAQTSGVTSSTPGAMKLHWSLGLGLAGAVTGSGQDNTDPLNLLGCNKYVNTVCRTLLGGVLTGYPSSGDLAAIKADSPSSYLSSVKAPTLLIQGEHDTLFNLNEAIATYKTLKAQRTPVKMIWQYGGHSGTNAPGEIDLSSPNATTQYETQRVIAWFAHYLQGKKVNTGVEFSYFRDWVPYSGIATPAFGTSDTFPVGIQRTYYLSAASTLVTAPGQIAPSTGALVTAPAGLPTSADPVDLLGALLNGQVGTDAEADLPGTALHWTTSALASPTAVAGSPTLHLKVDAPVAQRAEGIGPAGQLVLVAKVLDVAPDGSVATIADQVAPIRVPDVARPFTVHLPAIVHRFEAGHSIRVVVAAGSVNYRTGLMSNVVTVRTGSADQSLTLPVVAGG